MSALQKAAAQLCRGSLVLVRRPGAWVMAGEDWQTCAWRGFGVLGGGAWAGAAIYTERGLMWVAVGGFAALAFPAGRLPKQEKPGGEEPGEEPGEEEQPEEEPAGPGMPELVAAMHELADPHVHLSALARALGFGKDTARVRELLADAGVPIKTVRMGGKPSTGVDAAHFPPLPSPSSDAPEDVVAAGQASNNNSNNDLTVERRQGMTIIRVLSETARRRGTVPRH